MEDKLFKIIITLIIGIFISVISGIVGLCVSWHIYLYAPVVESTTSITGDSNVAGNSFDNSNLVDEGQQE